MAVMGPERNDALADEAFEKILRLLRDEYNVQRPSGPAKGLFDGDWTREETFLKDTIREMFWIRNMDGF